MRADFTSAELTLLLADVGCLSREERVARARLLDRDLDRLTREVAAVREQADREWEDLGGRP